MLAGATARDSVPALLQRQEIDFAFPVGRHVKVWLKPGADETGWRADMASVWFVFLVVFVCFFFFFHVMHKLALAQRAQRHA